MKNIFEFSVISWRWVGTRLQKSLNCQHGQWGMRHGLQLLTIPFVIGWFKYRLGLPCDPLHYWLTWPVGIPTVFETPVTVPLPLALRAGKCHIRHKMPQMITGMRRCVTHNDLWPWPISSRSFSHEFAKILLKYGTSCRFHSTALTVLDGFFPYWAQMMTGVTGCVMHNGLWAWSISSRSFSHEFAIKLLKYGTSCCVPSMAYTVLDGCFPYLAQMITIMRGCIVYNELWPWPLSLRSFSHDLLNRVGGAVRFLVVGTIG